MFVVVEQFRILKWNVDVGTLQICFDSWAWTSASLMAASESVETNNSRPDDARVATAAIGSLALSELRHTP